MLEKEPYDRKRTRFTKLLRKDDELRAIYRAQEKAQRDITTRLEDAEQSGHGDGYGEKQPRKNLEIAKKMKAQGFDMQMIQKFTDLTFEEIDKF